MKTLLRGPVRRGATPLSGWTRLRAAWITCLLAGLMPLAQAHTASTASLTTDRSVDPPALEWQVAWRDLDALLDLDADRDGQLTWAEAQAASDRIAALAAQSFESPGCEAGWQLAGTAVRGELGQAVLRSRAACALPAWAGMRYRFLDGIDPGHRLLLASAQGEARLVRPGDTLDASATAPGGSAAPLAGMALEGLLHILRGADHVIFVLTLVLPLALLTRRDERRAALRRLLAVVSAFTLAHSLTLALATLEVWQPPSAAVEPAIALSIAVAALYNLWLRKTHASLAVAFAFGLLHGFGFAEVLVPLQLPRLELAAALGVFNLGVEAGQLLVVAPAVLVLLALQRRPGLARRVHGAGSAAFAACGLLWFAQRLA
ncbi:HupE/UreJ family protein [Aquabacterium sp. A7-Y]|uniref:HupE/UreJ family protein n=1 Tax=Aquabacterium sp. A7-Y TaxID=1349605 RepID=UPI00223DBD75|nr:HupE/UreJ family protein [Aquabacterium sp. A7-Y]MCW7540581.1 HupE/UreJ family protein [Aquabacterium sp. A7-Y]